jgi:hypothetical protein
MELPATYDNERRYVFSNWTNEDFVGVWGGKTTTIKAGAILEVPMYLAYHYCKHLVDREMNKSGKASLIGDDSVRAPLEEKTICEITAGMDSPALATLKEQIKKEVEAEPKGDKKSKKEEFADLK